MERKILTQLIEWKNSKNRKPLVLHGARQVGKTFILKMFGKNHFSKVHYANFEKKEKLFQIFESDLSPKKILTQLEFFFDDDIDIKNDLVVFDEIQNCPRALTSLKYFCEDLPELAICSAGSLLGIYSGPVSYPVGKVHHINMYPMCFEEFLLAIEDKKSYDYLHTNEPIPDFVHDHLWERLKWYFVTGGLPEVVNIFCQYKDNLHHAFSEARIIQEDLISSYIADMAKHSGKINSMHLHRTWKAIPSQLADSHDGSAKKFLFKDVIPGVNRFNQLVDVIDWLNGAGLIIQVPIANCGKLPIKAYTEMNKFKLMIFDIGILGALGGLAPEVILNYDYGSYKGYFAENFVAQEFICSGEKELYSWQENKAEVEFLRVIHNAIVPIEVKAGKVTQSKSLKVFAEKYDTHCRVILSAKNMDVNEKSNTYKFPLYLAGLLSDRLKLN